MANFSCLYILPLLMVISQVMAASSRNLLHINDENWRDILTGEWMIAFFSQATWCPACKEMQKPWNSFADWSKDQKVKVAEVDLSSNAGLSGRFLVTALPTVYHIKDGVFRMYSGPKDKEDFIKFVKEKKWSTVEPLTKWFYPDSAHMAVVAWFFKFSMSAKEFHNRMVEKHGIPSWASYSVFGFATLVLGCILGFFMVLIIDCFVPSGKNAKKKPQPQPQPLSKKEKKAKKQQDKQDKQEKVEEKKSDDDFSELDALGTQSEGELSSNESKVRQRKKDDKKATPNGSQKTSPKSK